MQSLPSLPALPTPKLSIATSAGLLQGEARELVYQDNIKISELFWSMNTLKTVRLENRIVWADNLGIDLSISTAFPSISGTMIDTDFLNVKDQYAMTNYSEHTAYLEQMLDLSAGISWHFCLPLVIPGAIKKTALTPRLGCRYMTLSWNASGGFYQYVDDRDWSLYNTGAPWSSDIPKKQLIGTVITYQQEYVIPTTGLTLSLPLGQSFEIEIGADLSPYVWCNDIDMHLKKSMEYHDIMAGGYCIEPKTSVKWDATNHLSLFINGHWTYIDGLRGETYLKSISGDLFSKLDKANGGGAALNTWSIKLGAEFKSKD